jgi:hypothetical protein
MVTGTLELGGRPLADKRVLLISADMSRLLASATTDETGVFQFDLPDNELHSSAIIMAKIQGPVLAILQRAITVTDDEVSPDLHFEVSNEQFHTVRGRINSSQGWPPYLLLRVDPVRVAGIPEALGKFFNAIDEHVIESWFCQLPLDGDSFELSVQKGSYCLAIGYYTKSSPHETTENYSMTLISPDGENPTRLTTPYPGFVLNVERDRTVSVTIAPVTTENQ